jgi:tRNA 2-thiocytidine biosynthesis protein TtcA
MNFPIIPCNLCGSQENLQRKKIKAMLAEWEKEQPGRVNNIYKAISNVEPSHLGDRRLYDFENLNQSNKEENDDLLFTEDLIRNLNTDLNNITFFTENIAS